MIHTQAVPAAVERIRQRLLERCAPRKIILFGSYAHGQPTADSDLDLLVVMETSLPFWQRQQLVRQVIGPVELPVDVFVLTPEEFDETKDVVGGLAYMPAKYGQVIHENP